LKTLVESVCNGKLSVHGVKLNVFISLGKTEKCWKHRAVHWKAREIGNPIKLTVGVKMESHFESSESDHTVGFKTKQRIKKGHEHETPRCGKKNFIAHLN
jgi:hypothetical protein